MTMFFKPEFLLVVLILGALGCVVYFVRGRRRRPLPPAEGDQTAAQPDHSLTNSREDSVSLETADGHHVSGNGHHPEEPADFIDRKLVPVPARIYDNSARTVASGMLTANEVRQVRKDYGNLGRRWFRDGRWLYAVVRLVDGKCVPLQQYMTLSLKNPPERLHRALQQEETEAFYKPRDSRSILAKYGAYLLFAGIVVVILFLWGANMMKG